jgi:hypothetical protein
MTFKALNSVTNSNAELSELALTHAQWLTLDKIADFLQPMKDLTVKMSAGQCSTVSYIIPYFNIIIDHVEDVSERRGGSETRLTNAALAGREKMVQYYSKTTTTTTLCAALDPRKKFHYFHRKEFPDYEIDETKSLYVSLVTQLDAT